MPSFVAPIPLDVKVPENIKQVKIINQLPDATEQINVGYDPFISEKKVNILILVFYNQ